MKKKSNLSKIILIVLIIIGISLIIALACMKVAMPLMLKKYQQERDEERMRSAHAINQQLLALKKINSRFYVDAENAVYVSIPSENENCDGLGLPPLSENWKYRCKNKTDFRKIDGNGWIPVDFTKLNDKNITSLPIDPINNAGSLNYYTFAAINSEIKYATYETSWILTSSFESEKYLKKYAAGDNGVDSGRFEVSTNQKIWPNAIGLIGYWNFDDKENNTAKDVSGNENDGELINGPEQVFGKSDQAYLFNGKDEFIEIKNSKVIDSLKNITIEAWIKPLDMTQRILGKHNADSSGGWFLWYSSEGEFVFVISDGKGDIYLKSKPGYQTKQWSYVAAQYEDATKKMRLFVNGTKKNEITLLDGKMRSYNGFTIGKSVSGGEGFFNGTIDEIRLYNRILSEKEIQKSYLSAY